MRSSVQKSERQALIVNIVNATPIKRQSQLVSLLRKNGYSVTQTSISRDLDELGISKLMGLYRQSPEPKQTAFGLLSFKPSGDSMIVARCGAGLASALAVQLDSRDIDGVVGTIAGDDTVFIAVNDKPSLQTLLPKLREAFDAK